MIQFPLWPTVIRCFDLNGEESKEKNLRLRDLALERVDLNAPENIELRVHDFHKIKDDAIDWLTSSIKIFACSYAGVPVKHVGLRAVVLRHGKHICTHTETHESDLMLAYWPTGGIEPLNTNPNKPPDRKLAPTFVLEDPSRHLTDLRLPFESRHSVVIQPRQALMVIGPAHLPHNLHPYMGKEPFVHIVAQIRLDFPKEYEERW